MTLATTTTTQLDTYDDELKKLYDQYCSINDSCNVYNLKLSNFIKLFKDAKFPISQQDLEILYKSVLTDNDMNSSRS